MKEKGLLFLVAFVVVITSSIGVTLLADRPNDEQEVANDSGANDADKQLAVPQLESDSREDSATMILIGSPPMMPDDHANYWNPDVRHDSCLVCHDNPETGAPLPTADHYYNDDYDDKIFRDYCIQCHATQNDSKTAFNE